MKTSRREANETARRLMDAFVDRTGIDSDHEPRRYLWTDAFAVCNALGLGEHELAKEIVDQVHLVLGRHRDDDEREGWISGLRDDEGARHPTAGGLRIGKPLPERGPADPYDPRLEWERDGQYFHYLTKWVHALLRVATETGETRHAGWAEELAGAAHDGFTYRNSRGEPRMYWKMSIDLSRPLVPSMGHHDPLDGLLTYFEAGLERRSAPVQDAMKMCAGRSWVTDDSLGLGGLLVDVHRAARLVPQRGESVERLCVALLRDASTGLTEFVRKRALDRPTGHRLAFRELGLAIGLRAIETMRTQDWTSEMSPSIAREVEAGLDGLEPFAPLAERIIEQWKTADRTTEQWVAHQDINEVMLATALAPQGYLGTDGATSGRERPDTETTTN